MFVALVTIGVLLILFGGFVLLRFPDRAGAEVEFQSLRFHTANAGLPLIVLGVVTVVVAGLQFGQDQEPGVATPAGSTTTRPAQNPTTTTTWTPGSATADAPTSTGPAACLAEHFDTDPKVRPEFQKLSPLDQTVPVVPAINFALVFMEAGETTGAVRFKYEVPPGGPTLTVYDVVDAECQPHVPRAEEGRQGFLVAVSLPDRSYELSITWEDHPVYPRATARRVA